MKARVLVVVTVFVLMGVPLGLVGSQAAAQSVMSSGCELLNDPGWDGVSGLVYFGLSPIP